jgi:hypothetical protein
LCQRAWLSLNANTDIPAHRRDQLERLIRYTARGATSLERLAENPHGDLLYTFTRAWSDGTTGIKLSSLELLEKLAALVPPPRVHQVRYAGCLAAHRKLRGAITPTPRQQGIEAQASPASSISSRPLMRRILRHLKLAADPPPIVAARVAQRRFAWASA